MGRCLAVLALAVGLLGVAPAPEPAEAAPPAPKLSWHPCGGHFECATARVPLDHDDPRGVVQLRLIRLPATGPGERIGSLFVNPGGPGGSGVDMVRLSAAQFPEPIRERFDIVGFDPRGIVRSTPLRCYGSERQAVASQAPYPFPVTAAEQDVFEEHDRARAEECDRRGGRILDHMSTADVARDLDLLREAVGDDELHYLGLSYGTQLGMTYANLFPDRVGALVLDGVLDPIAWTTGRGDVAESEPFSTRLRSAEGARDTLDEFFRLCDEAGFPDCLLAPEAEARFEAVAESLRETPVELADPLTGEPLTFTYALLVNVMLQALYDPVAWPLAAELVAGLELEVPRAELGARYAALQQEIEDQQGRPRYPGTLEGGQGVFCADSDNPATYASWSEAAAAHEAEFGHFALPWTWLSSACAFWPGSQDTRYTGPWDAETANPVLLVGNRYDPATPYHGAQVADDLLPVSRLVTYEGWGHTAALISPCVAGHMTAYLVDGVVPPEGTSCPAGPSPFELPPVQP